MPEIGLFEVIGPRMVGPSSSHTAGACLIALTAQRLFGEKIAVADFTLYGSFARTYIGHGTDKALLGGILGYDTDDLRIRDSVKYAKKAGIQYSFSADKSTEIPFPNTVDIFLSNNSGSKTLKVRGVSTGGGKMKIAKLNDIDVDFTGEFPTLIIQHESIPGVISYFTGILSDYGVNVANMRCYRKDRHSMAYSIVESDQRIADEVIKDLAAYKPIKKIVLLQY